MATATVAEPKTGAVEPAIESTETLDGLILRILEDRQIGSAEELAKLVAKEVGRPVDVGRVAKKCDRLVRRGLLDGLRRDDLEIIRMLDDNPQGAPGDQSWVATPELNRALGWDSRRAYGRCKSMEDRFGLVESEPRQSEGLLFFFPVTGQILTKTTYPRIQEIVEDLKAIARGSGLTPGTEIPEPIKRKLIAEYRHYFESLRKGKPQKVQDQITAFEKQLMTVLGGTILSDVLGFLGIRAFHPRVRVWRLNRAASGNGMPVEAIRLRARTDSDDGAKEDGTGEKRPPENEEDAPTRTSSGGSGAQPGDPYFPRYELYFVHHEVVSRTQSAA